MMTFVYTNSSLYAQDYHLSQYEASPLYLNPAATGIFGFDFLEYDVRFGVNYRQQWRSIRSQYVDIPTPFTTYSFFGDYKSSFSINTNVLLLKKETLGEGHPDYLISLNNLADDYAKFGDYSTALKINQRVLDARKRTFGENHPDYLTSLSNQSQYFSLSGDFSTSKEINWEVVLSRKEILGEDHPDYLISLNNSVDGFMS